MNDDALGIGCLLIIAALGQPERNRRMSGATNLSECTSRYGGRGMCLCRPKCEICGHGKHAAIHGPCYGEQPGSKPWGHEYQPKTERPVSP